MRQSAAALGVVTLAALAACDVPTAVPKYDTEWNVPAKSTTISVNSLLPSGVTATSDNSAFQVSVSPSATSITRQLSQDCSACALANGQTVPKPAFVGGGSSTVALPSNVTSATLVRDTLTLTVANGFNFDPIRPSASGRGYLTITVASGQVVVGRDSIDGATTALPAGTSIVRTIPLTGAVAGASGLQVSTTLNSPAGDPVTMDASRSITVSGTVGQVYVSSAQVSLAGQSVSAPGTDLDLTSVSSSIRDRAGAGSLLLSVDNPFGVTGTLGVTIAAGATTLYKSVALASGVSAPVIQFSSSELQQLLGQHLSISFDGSVSGASVTVQPGQAVSVSSRLQIALNTTAGGSN
jgi:hypothetical protein